MENNESSKLELGDEVQYTLTTRAGLNGKVSAENISPLPKETLRSAKVASPPAFLLLSLHSRIAQLICSDLCLILAGIFLSMLHYKFLFNFIILTYHNIFNILSVE